MILAVLAYGSQGVSTTRQTRPSVPDATFSVTVHNSEIIYSALTAFETLVKLFIALQTKQKLNKMEDKQMARI